MWEKNRYKSNHYTPPRVLHNYPSAKTNKESAIEWATKWRAV